MSFWNFCPQKLNCPFFSDEGFDAKQTKPRLSVKQIGKVSLADGPGMLHGVLLVAARAIVILGSGVSGFGVVTDFVGNDVWGCFDVWLVLMSGLCVHPSLQVEDLLNGLWGVNVVQFMLVTHDDGLPSYEILRFLLFFSMICCLMSHTFLSFLNSASVSGTLVNSSLSTFSHCDNLFAFSFPLTLAVCRYLVRFYVSDKSGGGRSSSWK